VQVEHPSGDIVKYAYNGDGLCVLEDDGVQSLETLYDGLNRVLEADSGTIAADYTTTPEAYGDALSQHRSGDSSFYLWDGIRNVRQLTDGAEVVTDLYDTSLWRSSNSTTTAASDWRGKTRVMQLHFNECDVVPRLVICAVWSSPKKVGA